MRVGGSEMEGKENGTPQSPVLKKVLVLLDDLKLTPSGAILHGHVEQMLSELDAGHKEMEQAYAGFLEMLMEASIALIPADSTMHTHLRLLQMRLKPPLAASEVAVLVRAVEAVTDELTASSNSFQRQDLASALAPLMERFAGSQDDSPPAVQAMASSGSSVPPAPDHSQVDTPRVEKPEESSHGTRPSESVAEFQGNSAYRTYLDEKQEEMQKLQEDFISQLGEAVVETESFGRMLYDSMATIQQTESIDDLESRRRELVEAMEGMIGGHNALGERFSRAQEYLSIIEDDNQQLSNELDRVRLLSMTDELTRLPNRRAFMRRLEDEVSRVQRHSYPLGLVLIDIDHFKRINDEWGHAAGDEVLKCYADEILSIFRHHDLVARYGGEEFAVLLPNTSQDGVLRALEKVRCSVTQVKRVPDQAPMPTFSAGVAEFRPGEPPNSLIERADSALYAAKREGRNRTEVCGSSQNQDKEYRVPSGG